MLINLNVSFFSVFLIRVLIIFFCFLFFSSLQKGVWGLSEGWSSVFVLKCCVGFSLFCLLAMHLAGGIRVNLGWLFFGANRGGLRVKLDLYFILFFFVACFVSWSILEFSMYYMGSDSYRKRFFRLLLIFLLKMLFLTCSDRLFIFFVGWEGVGFLSFILIGWWKTRVEAQRAALQAVLYNRVGDVGVVFMVFLGLSFFNSWRFSEIFCYGKRKELVLFMFFGLLAAIGKSSQFGFHPWLPAAMEGPTPVSALLHSSTMVVAGVFLLVRMVSLNADSFFLDFCLFIGGLTSVFAARTACFQFDFKKVVAYSTTRQLGLMVGRVGLGLPLLAFFHICTHAFFKALLFLCSGRVIHRYGKEQDIRKIGNLRSSLPIRFSCFLIRSVSLSGIPFFSGFYSKDVILEGLRSSVFSFFGVFLMGISTIFTAFYSSRLVYYCLGGGSLFCFSPVREENRNLLLPMVRLLVGVFFFGFIFRKWVKIRFLLPSIFFKVSPLFFTLLGFCFGLVVLSGQRGFFLNLVYFFRGQWFFIYIIHRVSSILGGVFSLILRVFDRLVLSLIPEGRGLRAVYFTRGYTRVFHRWNMRGQVALIFFLILPYTKFFIWV